MFKSDQDNNCSENCQAYYFEFVYLFSEKKSEEDIQIWSLLLVRITNSDQYLSAY